MHDGKAGQEAAVNPPRASWIPIRKVKGDDDDEEEEEEEDSMFGLGVLPALSQIYSNDEIGDAPPILLTNPMQAASALPLPRPSTRSI
jgi:hypothetical protein